MGSALQKVGSAIPVVGLAAVGLGLALEANAEQAANNTRSQERMAQALLDGGKAADLARQAQDQLRQALDDPRLSDLAKGLARDTLAGVEKATQAQLDSMNAVQKAQQAATRAQNDYDYAVERFGETSGEAAFAQTVLKQRTAELEIAQYGAARAAKTQEQSLVDLANQALASANADLQLRQSRLAITQAQEEYTKAVKENGEQSLQAQQSALTLEAAYIRAAEGARQKAAADAAGLPPAQQQIATQRAYATELLNMAAAAGDKAPPALMKLIGQLAATDLTAAGATVAIGKTGDAVYSLPDGKTITIAAKDNASAVLQGIQQAANRIHDVVFNVTAKALGGLGLNIGGGHALGGPFRAGDIFPAGETGRELIVATQPGHVFTSAQTRALERGGGPGVKIENFNLRALSDRFVLADVERELYLAGLH